MLLIQVICLASQFAALGIVESLNNWVFIHCLQININPDKL